MSIKNCMSYHMIDLAKKSDARLGNCVIVITQRASAFIEALYTLRGLCPKIVRIGYTSWWGMYDTVGDKESLGAGLERFELQLYRPSINVKCTLLMIADILLKIKRGGYLFWEQTIVWHLQSCGMTLFRTRRYTPLTLWPNISRHFTTSTRNEIPPFQIPLYFTPTFGMNWINK